MLIFETERDETKDCSTTYLVKSREPDQAEEGEDPDPLVLVGTPPLHEHLRKVARLQFLHRSVEEP